MKYPSKKIDDAVVAFKNLPGVGEKTALRMVLYLLKMDVDFLQNFSQCIQGLAKVKECKKCHLVSDEDVCGICKNSGRNKQVVCVVENLRDVLAIESTQSFNGLYHVLGGVISPVNGIGPDELNMKSLIQRVNEDNVEELIMALSPSMEGDTTIYYLSKVLKDQNIKLTTISRGVSFGGELEYTDELTLARSISGRIPLENYLIN